jgi:hypothetical protein
MKGLLTIERHVDPDYVASVQGFCDCLDDIALLSDVIDFMTDWQVENLYLAIASRMERDTGLYLLN